MNTVDLFFRKFAEIYWKEGDMEFLLHMECNIAMVTQMSNHVIRLRIAD